VKPHLLEVSITNSPSGIDELEEVVVLVDVEVDDVLVSGVMTGLLVGEAVVCLVG